MWNEIAVWQKVLTHRPDLSAKTIASYTQDARRFATWLQSEHLGLKAAEVTSIDAKAYRDHLLAKRFALTTINRALINLMLFFDTINGINPFRHLTMIDVVEPAPVAYQRPNGMWFDGALNNAFATITDRCWLWLPFSAMQVHGSRKRLPFRFPPC